MYRRESGEPLVIASTSKRQPDARHTAKRLSGGGKRIRFVAPLTSFLGMLSGTGGCNHSPALSAEVRPKHITQITTDHST